MTPPPLCKHPPPRLDRSGGCRKASVSLRAHNVTVGVTVGVSVDVIVDVTVGVSIGVSVDGYR